jgi:hypothetical protein
LTLQRQGFEEVRHKTISHAIDAANDVPGLSDNALHLLHAIGDSCRLHHERYIPLCYEALDAMTGHACQPIEPVLVELSRLARIHILTVGLPYRDQPLAFVTIVCTSSDRTLGCLPNDVTNMNPTEGWSHE